MSNEQDWTKITPIGEMRAFDNGIEVGRAHERTRIRRIIEGAGPVDLWPDMYGTDMDVISRSTILAALDEEHENEL